MVKRPNQWKVFVDKENAFWISKGVVSESIAEKFRRFEKGRGQKLLVGAAAAIGTIGLLGIALLKFAYK